MPDEFLQITALTVPFPVVHALHPAEREFGADVRKSFGNLSSMNSWSEIGV
jgi:hypothetical protein